MDQANQEIESLVSTVQLISQDIGMEFGIKKCGVVVLKRGKLCKSEGIKFINGQTIKEVDDEDTHWWEASALTTAPTMRQPCYSILEDTHWWEASALTTATTL